MKIIGFAEFFKKEYVKEKVIERKSHRKIKNKIKNKNKSGKSYIAEITGKDSIAAVLQFVKNHKIMKLIGVGVHHRFFYGNLEEPINHFESLKKVLLNKVDYDIQFEFIYLDVRNLFEQLIIRTMAIVQKHYSYFSPCPACHLFFHMIRMPIGRYFDVNEIISGERNFHGVRMKLNQLPEVLSLLKKLIKKENFHLNQPIREITEDGKIFDILGNWKSAGHESCSFSKNYYDEIGDIPFSTENVLNSLEYFYFPLFSQVIEYIEKNKKEPQENWITEKIVNLFN